MIKPRLCCTFRHISNKQKKILRLLVSLILSSYIFFIQLHAVSCMWQVMQVSVKTLRSPLSVKFGIHCVLSGGTQRCALPRHQSEKVKILNITFPRVEIEITTCRL